MMKSLAAILFFVAMALPTAGHAAEPVPYLSLKPLHFYNKIYVKNDDLEPVLTISTERGWSKPAHWLAGVPDDVFLRIFMDKKTKVTVFQVVTVLNYYADGWRFYERANYATDTGPVATKAISLGNPQTDCSSRLMGCRFVEQVGFEVPESVLKAVADRYGQAQDVVFRFKVKSRGGDEYYGELSAAEVAGALGILTEHRVDMKPARAP